MAVHQDFLMRQIEIIARALAKLIFNKDTPEYIILNENGFSETDLLLKELTELINTGRINDAENLLFEYMQEEAEKEPESSKFLEIAIDFYSRLNNFSDKFLEKCGFERSEIDAGLREAAEIYNFDLYKNFII